MVRTANNWKFLFGGGIVITNMFYAIAIFLNLGRTPSSFYLIFALTEFAGAFFLFWGAAEYRKCSLQQDQGQ
jgi:threonine/homoserine/homoserine lactone efflux protein